MNLKTFLTCILALSLILSVLGAEWTWEYSGGSFFYLRGVSRTAPSILLFVIGLQTGAFAFKEKFLRWLLLLSGLGLFASIYAYNLSISSSDVSITDIGIRDTILSTLQAILCIPVVYCICKDTRLAQLLLKIWLVFFGVVSIYMVCIKLTGLSKEVGFMNPGWPTVFYIILPFAWYLHEFLTSPRLKIWGVIVFSACSLDIAVSFQKPILFTTMVCVLILFFVAVKRGYIFRTFYRMIFLAALGGVAFVVADQASMHRISSIINEKIESKFLHQDYGRMPTTTWEVIDRASGSRIYIWQEAWRRFTQKPMIGWGPGQKIEPKRHEESLAGQEAVVLHNVYLELLVSVGIIGTLPIILAILWWYRLVLRQKVLRQVGYIITPCVAYVTALLCYNLVGSGSAFFSFHSFIVSVMALAAALADQALKASQQVKQTSLLPVGSTKARSLNSIGLPFNSPRNKPI
jgi:O-antigen ligase